MFSYKSKAALLISLCVIFTTEVVIYVKLSMNTTNYSDDIEQSSYSHKNDREQIGVFTENMERAFNYHAWIMCTSCRKMFCFNQHCTGGQPEK